MPRTLSPGKSKGGASNELLMQIDRVVEQRISHHSGPVPPPETMGGYEQLAPGATERIFGWAEAERLHRHDQEKEAMAIGRQVSADTASATSRGQWMAFGICIGTLALAGLLAYTGQGTAAASVAGTVIAALAFVFAVGQAKRKPPE